jgi:hypothetical protein
MTQFMKPQIEFGEWLEVDGACGIEAIPADLIGGVSWMTPDVDYDTDCIEEDSNLRNVLDALEDFIESNIDDVTSIQLVEGYGARLSAPGYMDCTAWTVFKTREEAEEFLREEYEVEEEMEDE